MFLDLTHNGDKTVVRNVMIIRSPFNIESSWGEGGILLDAHIFIIVTG